MIEDTLTKAAMSSLKIAVGAVLTGAMTVLLESLSGIHSA